MKRRLRIPTLLLTTVLRIKWYSHNTAYDRSRLNTNEQATDLLPWTMFLFCVCFFWRCFWRDVNTSIVCLLFPLLFVRTFSCDLMQKFKFLSTRGRVGWYLNDTTSAVIRPSSGQYPGRGPSPYHSLSGSKRHNSTILSTDIICVVWKKRISKWAEEPHRTLGATRTVTKKRKRQGSRLPREGLWDCLRDTLDKHTGRFHWLNLVFGFWNHFYVKTLSRLHVLGFLKVVSLINLTVACALLMNISSCQEFPQACCFLKLTW